MRTTLLTRAMLGASLCAAALAGSAGVAHAVTLNDGDVDFILEQIEKAEAHAAGGELLGPGEDQVGSPQLSQGLRTVDGTFNNLVPGQEDFGAADRLFPRLSDPFFRPADIFDPPGSAPPAPTSYEQTSGIVADSEPRVISNLIVDQTTGNPAAQAAADATEGSETDADGNFFIPNHAPDEGLSAPFNSWFTFFGQFFDHGLDLTTKGQSGTVIVPLKEDDPLFRPGSPTNFMVLSRARNQAGPDGLIGTTDDVREHTNTTTPFVDQNQTYTSHPSHQVFLREYELDDDGENEYKLNDGQPVSTGRLLERAATGEGLATWADVKEQARTMLGIELDDQDVLDVPLVKTDQYGEFDPDPATGFARIVTSKNPVTFDSGTPANPVDATDAVRTRHAFLDDIAHHANPFGDHDNNPSTQPRPLTPDSDPGFDDDNDPATYDDEMLDRHFITGDGRGNENIGLTAVHHVFHSEHNRQVNLVRNLILEPGGPDPEDWELDDGDWDGERLFQAARFVTEMQYQHLVFEEFARKVQPQVNVFSGYDVDIDAAITAEFAHTVYRFGHSMLTEKVARENADGSNNDIGLIDAFLNPLAYNDGGSAGQLTSAEAAGSIIRGTTKDRGNEIDEFVTGALRNNLLGLPLDLATINIARGRDTGVPPLNSARRTFHEQTGDAALEPYSSWNDFELAIKHPESLVNFVAAYGTHPTVVDADTTADRREAARLIVEGGPDAPDDRLEFLNSEPGSEWENTESGMTTTGVDLIDFWIGGLAERQMPFGGMLGVTFNFVFETQMEKLQDGDRLYYLERTVGLNFLTQLEENSFAELVQRNTDVGHLPGDIFSRPDYIFELANLGTSGPVLDDPATDYDESALLVREPDGTVRFPGGEHVVMGGTGSPDRMRAGDGDDTLWGDADADRLEGDAGNDLHNGGGGDDILTDIFGDDNIKAGDGDDAIHGGQGFDLLLGGFGNDFVVGGSDPKETFAGGGDDYVIGGDSFDIVFGNEGDDWVEGGTQADSMLGENGDPFEASRLGDDVLNGEGGNDDYDAEGGDDVMLGGSGTERFEGMIGFDWVTNKGSAQPVDWDLDRTGLEPPEVGDLADRFDLVEGLSGWNGNDVLRGDSVFGADDAAEPNPVPEDHDLTNPGLIGGLSAVLGGASSFTGGNILLGGAGSDVIEGRGGNDIIDGDRWLNTRISVRDPGDPSIELRSVDNMRQIQADVLAGRVNPGQLRTVREIERPASTTGDVDTVEFTEDSANYDFVPGRSSIEMRVVHARGTQVDGTDVLRNVERLRFPNRTINLTPPPPRPATGTVEISDTTPREDQLLTAGRAFDDLNGVDTSTIVYHWQAENGLNTNVWAPVATGANFTPRDAEVGSRLRVVARFNDLDGTAEKVTSAPTSAVRNVNDLPTGQPTLNDTTPTRGEQVKASLASIADADGLLGVTFSIRWQEGNGTNFSNIPGATERTFTPGAAQVGDVLRAVVSYTDDEGTQERLNSAASSPVTDRP